MFVKLWMTSNVLSVTSDQPMIEVEQQHYQAGERFLSSGDCLRLSRRCSRRHGSPRARVAVVTLVPP